MKKIGQHFISKLPPKKVSRGTPSTLSTPQSVYEEDLAEETAEKRNSKKPQWHQSVFEKDEAEEVA